MDTADSRTGPLQAKVQGGSTAPSSRKLDWRFTEHDPAHQSKTCFPYSQSLPSRSLHKPLILIHQRAERRSKNYNPTASRTKITITELTKMNIWITALCNSMKLWSMSCRGTQCRWVVVESSDKMWSTGNGNASHFSKNTLVLVNTLFQQHKTLHVNITRWSILKSDRLYSLRAKMEKLYTVTKNKTWSWLWLRSWAPCCKTQT